MNNIQRMYPRLILVVLTLGLLSACVREQPVHNVSETPFPFLVSQTLTQDEVAAAISKAGLGRNESWQFKRESRDLITAELFIRQHYAKVRIPFSTSRFSIIYDDSRVLRYDGQNIHRNYNKWVKLLEDDIVREASKAAAEK